MTAVFKQLKSPKLDIVLQLTEVTPGTGDPRVFEVHDVERNRGFRVLLPARAGAPPDTQLHAAIGLAIERVLVTPPEKVAGTLYDVELTSADIAAARS
ncbi:MAG TPA: hypothetical protein VFD71_02435 [Planctomycetota bacterium]|jgi:hypothetical protein|nr:hypothetical protein [Planctomycetota bacterium]